MPISGLKPESYVYMLLCEGSAEWPVYIKIGMSREPYKRLASIMTGCPAPAIKLATCPVRSTRTARRLEKSLLNATAQWTSHGEWRRFKLEDKAAFNGAWKALFEAKSDYAWPLRWDMHSVSAVQKMALQRANAQRARYVKRGPAYRDFSRDSQT